jgi:hypothetical protein
MSVLQKIFDDFSLLLFSLQDEIHDSSQINMPSESHVFKIAVLVKRKTYDAAPILDLDQLRKTVCTQFWKLQLLDGEKVVGNVV